MRNPLAVAARSLRGEAKAYTTAELLPGYLNKVPQWLTWSTRRAIEQGYKASSVVYACVSVLMQAVASVPWYAYTQNGDGQWEPDETHSLSTLLAYPNPVMSRAQLMQRLTAHLQLGGNALWSKIVVRGQVTELWPVDPSLVVPVPSVTQFIDHYRYTRGGEFLRLEPEEVIHFMLVDPDNPYWGLGRLQAIARVVDTDVEAVRWNKVALQNRAVTDGHFSVEQPLTKEQRDLLIETIRESHGGPDNARRPLVLGGNTKWIGMSQTPVEMDFIDSRKLSREEIASGFGVPLPLIGIYENATLANIDTARQILWGDTVVPFNEGVKDALNLALVPPAERGRLMLAPDYSDVKALRDDLAKKVETFAKMVGSGIPINAAVQRLELDLEPIEGGDVSLVPATWVPLSEAGAPTADPRTDPGAAL